MIITAFRTLSAIVCTSYNHLPHSQHFLILAVSSVGTSHLACIKGEFNAQLKQLNRILPKSGPKTHLARRFKNEQ